MVQTMGDYKSSFLAYLKISGQCWFIKVYIKGLPRHPFKKHSLFFRRDNSLRLDDPSSPEWWSDWRPVLKNLLNPDRLATNSCFKTIISRTLLMQEFNSGISPALSTPRGSYFVAAKLTPSRSRSISIIQPSFVNVKHLCCGKNKIRRQRSCICWWLQNQT